MATTIRSGQKGLELYLAKSVSGSPGLSLHAQSGMESFLLCRKVDILEENRTVLGAGVDLRSTGFGAAWGRLLRVLRNPFFLILFAALPVFVADLGTVALHEGEGMYAEVAREMRLSGDWITPHLNGKRHFDKPPLAYWSVAIGQILFGETEFSARIGSALAAWATIPVVGAIAGSLYGAQAGWLGALVFATSVGPFIFGRQIMPDPFLIFWITFALLGYVKGYLKSEEEKSGIWPWVMFASLGMASLAKNILGIGLPTAIIGLHVIFTGRLKSFLLSWKMAAGLFLTALIALPWPIAVSRANPDFFGYFVIRENFMRFTGQRYPPDEFLSLPVFLILTWTWTFPWMSLVPQALWRGIKRIRHAQSLRSSVDLLLFIWIGFVVGLFSASHSRLEYYAMPSIPAFAVLVAKLWDELLDKGPDKLSSRSIATALGCLAAAALAAAFAAIIILGPSKDLVFEAIANSWPSSGWVPGPDQNAVLERIRIPTILTMCAIAAFMTGALFAAKRSKPKLCLGLLSGLMVPLFIMIHWGFIVMQPFMSSRDVARIVSRNASPTDTVVFQEPHEYMWVGGLTFYTKRMVHIFKDPRLDGIASRKREPAELFLDRNGLEKLWDSGKKVLVVADEDGELATLVKGERTAQEIWHGGGRVVFCNGFCK